MHLVGSSQGSAVKLPFEHSPLPDYHHLELQRLVALSSPSFAKSAEMSDLGLALDSSHLYVCLEEAVEVAQAPRGTFRISARTSRLHIQRTWKAAPAHLPTWLDCAVHKWRTCAPHSTAKLSGSVQRWSQHWQQVQPSLSYQALSSLPALLACVVLLALQAL